MGDSDDEREFRRRDKFHNERRGYEGGGGGMSRGEWREPRPLPPPSYAYRGRPAYGGGGGGGRDRYSPEPRSGRRHHEMSPPPKRMRGGWEDERGFGGGGGGGYDRGDYEREYDRPPPPRQQHAARHKQKDEDLEGFQPAMMSFKAFMQTQDDSISDEEGIKKYAEYKLEFKRQQLNEFFVSHKEEEWFKQKYHPDDSVQRKEELKAMLNKRVEVFQDFMSSEKFKDLSLDGDKQDVLIKVLDSVVIKLEGGSDFDLRVLDLPEAEEERREDGEAPPSGDTRRQQQQDTKRKKDTEEEFDAENAALMKKAKEFLQFMEPEQKKEKSKERKTSEEKSPKKRKREEISDEETEEDKSKKEEKKEEEEAEKEKQDKEEKGEKEKEEEQEEEKEELELSDIEDQEEDKSKGVKKDAGDSTSKGSSQNKKKEEEEEEESLSSEEEEETRKGAAKEEKTKKPRALHKTSSIFLRNLAPTITKHEVEAMCRRYDGFLRAAIADPAPDRRWFRRGWVTFRRDVKIKDICFNLNNIRLKDCELGPIVNRDLTRRIRTVPGLTCDRKVVRNDIRLAAKIITNLDTKWGLWPTEKKDDVLGLASANPLLANITDYLIEEASAEEEELLGKKEGEEEEEEGEEGGAGGEGDTLFRDEELIKVLDRMILYLRIVHSVDFYNHSEYPNEDEMPNRCGILHVRGLPPATKVTVAEMEEYMASFEKKMGGFLTPRHDLTDEEAMKLGLKNEEEEVEKFVMANTQELAKDKWLCPLSGKKFKGPDFVRKHIFNKHAEKVEEVKKEVRFYNSYLKDPKRPQLPEHPNNKPGARPAGSSSSGQPRPGDPYEYSGPNRDVTKYPVFGDRGYDRYERGYRQGALPPPISSGSRRDPYPPPGRSGRLPGGIDSFTNRPIITYRDWDAPNDEYF